LVYEKLEALARRGDDMAICVLAHTSDKKNEYGYSSNIPSGSFVIRSVPRWFVYLKRTSGVLSLAMSGNSGGRPWGLTLSEPTDTPRFDVLEEIPPDELAERSGKRNRTRGKLDRWAEYKSYADANPGATQRDVAEHFKTSVSTVNRALKSAR
jgi:Winged helix-turn-helix DNA-binding